MKLIKHSTGKYVDKKEQTKEYVKYEIVIPKEVVDSLRWDETTELEYSIVNNTLQINAK